MPTPERRPERRNRKIGTAASGYGQSNKMKIPESWVDSTGRCTCYYERIQADFTGEYAIGERRIKVFYEKPWGGFSYGCSPEDVVHVLSQVPSDDIRLLDYVVFRQPTRKQLQQFPVWGRLIYCAEIGDLTGPTIFLESQELGSEFKWPRKLNVEDRAEVERLKADGHIFEDTRRHHINRMTEPAIRNTLLYRTLLHELGHWVDYDRKVLSADDVDLAADLYFARPRVEREQFAHRYAEEMAARLRAEKTIPFAPLPSKVLT